MARILIVDDQPAVLVMLESLLVQKGHLVTSARDAFDALEKVKNQKFEMVISDVAMPGGVNGFSLVKTLRADANLSDLIIVLLTGKRDRKDVEHGIDVGVDDYCIKPLDPDIFLAKIESLFLKKLGGQTDFQEILTSEDASFPMKLKIVGISEVGMSFESSQPFHIGSKIKVESEFFDRIGVEAPHLRIVSCDYKGNLYRITVAYIGVGEKFLQPLRVWRQQKKSAA